MEVGSWEVGRLGVWGFGGLEVWRFGGQGFGVGERYFQVTDVPLHKLIQNNLIALFLINFSIFILIRFNNPINVSV